MRNTYRMARNTTPNVKHLLDAFIRPKISDSTARSEVLRLQVLRLFKKGILLHVDCLCDSVSRSCACSPSKGSECSMMADPQSVELSSLDLCRGLRRIEDSGSSKVVVMPLEIDWVYGCDDRLVVLQ